MYKVSVLTHETYPGDMLKHSYSLSIQSAVNLSKMHLYPDKKQNKGVVLTLKIYNSAVFLSLIESLHNLTLNILILVGEVKIRAEMNQFDIFSLLSCFYMLFLTAY